MDRIPKSRYLSFRSYFGWSSVSQQAQAQEYNLRIYHGRRTMKYTRLNSGDITNYAYTEVLILMLHVNTSDTETYTN